MRLPAARDAWHSRAATAAPLAADSSMKPSWLQRPRIHPGQTRPRVRYERRRDRDCHAAPVATLINRCSKSSVRAKELRGPCAATAALRWSRSPPTMASRIQPTQNLPPLGNELALAARAATGAGDLMRIALLRPARDRDRGRFATATAASCVTGSRPVYAAYAACQRLIERGQLGETRSCAAARSCSSHFPKPLPPLAATNSSNCHSESPLSATRHWFVRAAARHAHQSRTSAIATRRQRNPDELEPKGEWRAGVLHRARRADARLIQVDSEIKGGATPTRTQRKRA